MKSITNKKDTLRTAVAESNLKAKPETIKLMQANELPKKDVLIVARVAGVNAAKQTSDLIPYCHPLPIDHVDIEYDVTEESIKITATVTAIWKTGVEMEALTAASIAALTIYDMLKPVDKEMEIVSTVLVSKKGGKTSFVEHIPKDFRAAVIVTSDGTFAGKREDKSGQVIKEFLKGEGIEHSYDVLPDEADQITTKVEALCSAGVKLIITTGGTGLGPRDVTVEAVEQIIEREIPGIMEAARNFGQKRTPYAMLSRGIAGQKGETIIITLPGSSKGVEESLHAIFPAILHAYKMMAGKGH